jgi:hypothetical protein
LFFWKDSVLYTYRHEDKILSNDVLLCDCK